MRPPGSGGREREGGIDVVERRLKAVSKSPLLSSFSNESLVDLAAGASSRCLLNCIGHLTC